MSDDRDGAASVETRREQWPPTRSEHSKMVEQIQPRPVRPQPVTVSPFGDVGAGDDDVIAMLVEGSFDAEVRVKNYLPARMDAVQATAYCATRDGVVLRLGGRPVGVAVALHEPSPGDGVEIPPGCVELDMWVLPAFRGQGVRWFPLIAEWLARRFDHVLGVTWEDNHTAVALLRWSGWRHLGRSYWSCDGCAGYCEVFLYDLKAYRERRK